MPNCLNAIRCKKRFDSLAGGVVTPVDVLVVSSLVVGDTVESMELLPAVNNYFSYLT